LRVFHIWESKQLEGWQGEMMSEDLRYPVGRFKREGAATYAQREHWIQEIEQAPARLRAAVDGLSDARLDTPYREGGWTIRQVVHHLPDSHMNAYVRFRLALTEDNPTIKPYDQSRWAELEDAKRAPIAPSLALLEGLHARWAVLLRSIGADDFARTLEHPEHGTLTLDHLLAMYAWHGRHHLAHITSLRERLGWGEAKAAGA
jgi:uncharacterized damage-inducible protein DinB